jgi:hypothetical protein
MDTNPNKYSSTVGFVKKYIPYAFLIALTIFLMILFKHNRSAIGQFIEEGKNNILSLYSQNLKPLLFKTRISEEDIFNFALYQSLPIDKEKNKVLFLRDEASGNQVFEIRSVVFNPSTQNYESFKKFLNLNEVQKEKADSILNSYKKEIYSSVFVNDKNTFAVNPKINQLQQAILADLISFSQNIDKKKTVEIFHKSFTGSEDENVASLISSVKQANNKDFILVTPDTVANTRFNWNEEKFNSQLEEMEKNKEFALKKSKEFNLKLDLAPMMEEVEKTLPKQLTYTVNPEMYKVEIPNEARHITKMINDSLRTKLKDVRSKLRTVAEELRKQSSKSKFHMSIPIPQIPNMVENFGQEMAIDPTEIASNVLEGLSNMDFTELAKYGAKMDSVSKYGNKEMNDSMKKKIMEQILKMKKDFKKKKLNTKTNVEDEN